MYVCLSLIGFLLNLFFETRNKAMISSNDHQIPAMKKNLEAKIEEEKALAIWDLGSPLYDSYELVSLTHLIERHLMTLPSLGGSKRVKKISPASDLAASLPADQVLFLSETKRLRSSSSVSKTLSAFVREKLWIKRGRCRNIGSCNRKMDRSNKSTKAGRHCGFCFRFANLVCEGNNKK